MVPVISIDATIVLAALLGQVYSNANWPTVCIGSIAAVLIDGSLDRLRRVTQDPRVFAADANVVEQDRARLARMVGAELQVDTHRPAKSA